jgi:hypothetical protein
MEDKIAVLERPNANSVHIDAAISGDEQWEIVFVFPNLDARDDFMDAVNKTDETGVTRPMRPFCAKFIRRWPYSGLNPSNVEDYGKLSPEQWDKEVVPNLIKALETFRRKTV